MNELILNINKTLWRILIIYIDVSGNPLFGLFNLSVGMRVSVLSLEQGYLHLIIVLVWEKINDSLL